MAKRIKVTHIFLGGGEQWCTYLIRFYLNKENVICNQYEHYFVSGDNDFKNNKAVKKDNRIHFSDGKLRHDLSFLYEYAHKSDLVFIYNNLLSTYDRAFIRKNILKKIVWISFGSDIDVENEAGWHGNHILVKCYNGIILQFLERKSKENMSKIRCICTIAMYDGLAIRRDYKNVKLLPYSYLRPSPNTLLQYNNKIKENDEIVRVMVGHHGYPGVNHKDCLNKLVRFKNENLQIYLPMTYGDGKYIDRIREYAKNIFKNKIHIITEPMEYSEYIDFISKMDILILDTKKNIASGNVNMFCYFGKKLYLTSNGKIAERLALEGIYTYDINNIKNESFEEFSCESIAAESEKKYAEEYFKKIGTSGRNKVCTTLKKIYEDFEKDE